MTTFLTTSDVQELIHVDRSTVYRMAEDGRLPAVKVGRQWRFPADRIAEQLGIPVSGPPDAPAPGPATAEQVAPTPPSLADLLVPEVAQSIADLLGDLFGITAVVTDMSGNPLSEVANPCGFYAAIADRPGAAEACLAGWRQFASEPHVAPRFVESHLGFLCARTFVWVDLQPVGMIVVGGVTPRTWPPASDRLASVAAEVGVDPAVLHDHVDETWTLDGDRQRWILQMLPQLGDLVSQLASARSQLPLRLDALAAPGGPSTTPSPPLPGRERP